MHSWTTAAAAVAVFITSVALGACGRGVLLLLVLLLPVGDRMLEVRLGSVHARLVHADFELAVSGHGSGAASVVVLVEGVEVVEVVAVIALGSMRSFDQRVDHKDQ